MLSKENYCCKIHQLLTKSSAYHPSPLSIDNLSIEDPDVYGNLCNKASSLLGSDIKCGFTGTLIWYDTHTYTHTHTHTHTHARTHARIKVLTSYVSLVHIYKRIVWSENFISYVLSVNVRTLKNMINLITHKNAYKRTKIKKVMFLYAFFIYINYIIHCKIIRHNHQIPKIVRVPGNKTNPKKIK